MGQNMVGNIRLHVRGPRGTVARLRYAERLNPDGSIYTTNLRNADATDTYALGNNYANWLAPDQNTPQTLIDTAYWALVAREMAEMATALHRPADAPPTPHRRPKISAAIRPHRRRLPHRVHQRRRQR